MENQHPSPNHPVVHTTISINPHISTYWPIGTIYLAAIISALYTTQWHSSPDYMSQVMGIVLVLFGCAKLTDITGFADGFSTYDPIAAASRTYARGYPFMEIVLGILFILQLLVLPATLITLVIYSATVYGTIRSLSKKLSVPCVCLGTHFTLPLSRVTILEGLFMVLMCLWMLTMFTDHTVVVT